MDFSGARERAESGMALAEAKANSDKQGWSEDAIHGIELYCLAHDGKQFLAEEVREWAEQMELVEAAENERSWGAIFQRAARMGIIKRTGYAPARSSNLAPKYLWTAA